MAKRGGFPGGGMGMPGNMNNLMKQAQRMQRQMEEGQKELETKEFTAKAGGGAVEVTVSGRTTTAILVHGYVNNISCICIKCNCSGTGIAAIHIGLTQYSNTLCYIVRRNIIVTGRINNA